jgi:nitrite reductase (NO-forming)
MLKVKGEEEKTLYSGVKQEGIYNPEGGTIQEMPDDGKPKVVVKANKTLEEKIASGKNIYTKTCFACHQANGEGIANAFPPLAKSDYLNADVSRAINIVLKGKTGEITVNDAKYNSVMTKQTLTDDEVADVLTYVYNSWGNNKTNVKVSDVQAVKNGH